MNNYKLILLDLDGTLLTSDKEISKRTFEALQAAYEQGIKIVPCTGRFFELMPAPVKNLPFLEYAICINGSNIYDVKNKNDIHNDYMDIDGCMELVDYLSTIDVLYDAYIDNWGYMNRDLYMKVTDPKYVKNKYYIQNFIDYRKPVDSIKDIMSESDGKVQKIQFYTQDKQLLADAYSQIEKLFPNFIITSSMENDCEVNNKTSTKGNALIKLAEYLHIDIKDTMVFGDGGNDLSMVTRAGFGIAMGNAKPFLKEAADYITLDNDSDGIAYALEKFVLH